jgi:hypothetical protein
MGRPKKNKEEKEEVKGVVAKGFIDIETHNDIAQLAERRGEIIATLQQRIGGYEADMRGMQDKLKFCESSDERIVKDVIDTLSKLEGSLLRGLGELGEVTQADIVYNMNLMKRIITKKHGRK